MTAPDVDTILRSPVVLAELEAAWEDSLADDPSRRHEEGGWVYYEPATGRFQTRRAPVGDQAFIDLSDPPTVEGAFLVATYHSPESGIRGMAHRPECLRHGFGV
jgi:hypothetical protein